MITDELSIPQIQVFEIVTKNLVMGKICAKFVPKMLSEEQKINRKAICLDLLHHVNEDSDFLDNVVIDDEA